MKKTIILLITLMAVISAYAQPSAVQKVAKSVFTITTYKADGSILATTHGVYYNTPGEGLASFKVFNGAHSATIIDASGKKSQVESIMGASEVYDLCRFRLSTANGVPVKVATEASKTSAWMMPYSTKKAKAAALSLKNSEDFDKYTYYIYNEETDEDNEGCPILNDAGELLGIVQGVKGSFNIHSTDARYALQLMSNGLSVQDAVMSKINIRPTLPEDKEQARLMLLMITSRNDSAMTVNCINDYLRSYPTDIDGYSAMARQHIAHKDYAQAEKVMGEGVQKAVNQDEAQSDFSRIIYETIVFRNDSLCPWTISMAEEHIHKAIEQKADPGYKHQLAQILFMQKDYAQAYDLFYEVAQSDLSSSEVYYEAAQSKLNLNADKAEVLSLLDKAVEKCPTPLTSQSAPYIFARGALLDEMGEYRKAMRDYNLYDTLMYFRADANFYYLRYQCETKIRQYQQALNDIAHAVYLTPDNVTYIAEMAALQLKVGRYEDAVMSCQLGRRVTEEYADIHIIEGVAQYHLGKKAESHEAFNKAAALGDERATEYLNKYK